MTSTYEFPQPLYCHIPTWHQQQQQHQQRQQQQQQLQQAPRQSPPVAAFLGVGGALCSGYNPCVSGQTHVQLSPQQQQQFLRPYDLGYESDKDHQQHQQQHQQHQYHQQQHHQQHQHHPQQQPAAQLTAGPSPGGSTCDSARAESPADAQLAEVANDLAGFSLTGPRPVDMALSQKMEIVWHQRFLDFFSRFPVDTWHLLPVFDPPDSGNTGISRGQWRYFKDQAKVRFICTGCQKAWTSMGGQVVFWIYRDTARNTGYVHFKLYGQKCADCCPEFYEHAIWYQEEVEKVIENLYNHVGQMFYGQHPQRRRVDRRAGQPRKEHNTGTCQACQENVCRMGQVLRKKLRTEA